MRKMVFITIYTVSGRHFHAAEGAFDGRPAAAGGHHRHRTMAARAHPRTTRFLQDRVRQIPGVLHFLHPTGREHLGVGGRGIVALLNPDKLRRVLGRMLDEKEFLGPIMESVRLSKYHLDHPYIFSMDGRENRVDYLPAESNSGLFGGNSNWRGPIWMPVNAVIIRALMQFYTYYGDNFKIECPTGSGRLMNLYQVAKEIVDRLAKIFCATSMGAGRFMAARRSSSPIPIGATTFYSMSISTATMAPAWEQPSDRMDRTGRRAD